MIASRQKPTFGAGPMQVGESGRQQAAVALRLPWAGIEQVMIELPGVDSIGQTLLWGEGYTSGPKKSIGGRKPVRMEAFTAG